MRIAYFDCFSGVSGDMILGALIDAGADLHKLESELGKLKISGFTLKAEKTTRRGLSGTRFFVDADHSHAERHLTDIEKIMDNSDLAMTSRRRPRQSFATSLTSKRRSTTPIPETFIFMRSADWIPLLTLLGLS